VGDRIRYDPYGTFQAFPAGDVNNDGTVDSADSNAFIFVISYQADLDLTLNGSIGQADQAVVTKNLGRTLGNGQLSDRGNIVGWCGYLYEESTGMWLARHRWQIPELGRWTNRDPIGYAGGSQNLYEYVNGNPVFLQDPMGLSSDDQQLAYCESLQSSMQEDAATVIGNVDRMLMTGYADVDFALRAMHRLEMANLQTADVWSLYYTYNAAPQSQVLQSIAGQVFANARMNALEFTLGEIVSGGITSAIKYAIERLGRTPPKGSGLGYILDVITVAKDAWTADPDQGGAIASLFRGAINVGVVGVVGYYASSESRNHRLYRVSQSIGNNPNALHRAFSANSAIGRSLGVGTRFVARAGVVGVAAGGIAAGILTVDTAAYANLAAQRQALDGEMYAHNVSATRRGLHSLFTRIGSNMEEYGRCKCDSVLWENGRHRSTLY